MSNWGFWDWIGNSVYVLLAIDALWGAYCAALVWMRLGQLRFRTEPQQDAFMAHLEPALQQGDLNSALSLCDGDRRALPQLLSVALKNLQMGTDKLVELVSERFQRDVMQELEGRVSWINNVIKTAPMLGLLGTVLGMMGAFGKLAGSKSVQPEDLAGDISVALITTAIGLAIAIPATVFIASVNLRIRHLDELVGAGLNRFFDVLASLRS
jgi:biopolymer transport protein ExbB/TolQ